MQRMQRAPRTRAAGNLSEQRGAQAAHERQRALVLHDGAHEGAGPAVQRPPRPHILRAVHRPRGRLAVLRLQPALEQLGGRCQQADGHARKRARRRGLPHRQRRACAGRKGGGGGWGWPGRRVPSLPGPARQRRQLRSSGGTFRAARSAPSGDSTRSAAPRALKSTALKAATVASGACARVEWGAGWWVGEPSSVPRRSHPSSALPLQVQLAGPAASCTLQA